MNFLTIALFSSLLFFSPLARAEEKTFIDSQMVGMVNTVKFMAKAYIMSTDFEATKKKYIDKINAMSNDEFKANYALAYSYIGQSQMPAGFKANMTKKSVIRQLQALDKEKLAMMIDQIDSEFIAKELKTQLAVNNFDTSKFNMQAVTKVWSDFKDKLN